MSEPQVFSASKARENAKTQEVIANEEKDVVLKHCIKELLTRIESISKLPGGIFYLEVVPSDLKPSADEVKSVLERPEYGYKLTKSTCEECYVTFCSTCAKKPYVISWF